MSIILIIIVLFVLYYILTNYSESFSGIATENAFSNLSCIVDAQGNQHIFKVSPSLNVMNNGKPYSTIDKLLHPTRTTKVDPITNLPSSAKNAILQHDAVNMSDFIDVGDSVPCDDSDFSAYYTKQIRNPTSNAKKLFSAINSNLVPNKNSSWQNQECTAQELNEPGHWCNNIQTTINNNPDLCSSKVGKIPAQYCSQFNDTQTGVVMLAKSNDKTSPGLLNFFNTVGLSKHDQCVRSAGAIPQAFTDAQGNFVCLKDGGISNPNIATCSTPGTSGTYNATVNGNNITCKPGDIVSNSADVCSGTPLFNFVNGSVVDSWTQGCKKCASRASTSSEKISLANSPWPFPTCIQNAAL